MLDANRLAELFNGVHLGEENSLGCCNFCDASPEIREFVEAALKVVRCVHMLTTGSTPQLTVGYMRRELRKVLAPFQAQEKEKP